MEKKNIIILENKPEDFIVFLHCLQQEVRDNYRFHLITDTRNYHVTTAIGCMAMNVGLDYFQYDGSQIVDMLYRQYNLLPWFLKYHKSLKLSLPIIFPNIIQYLYIDDDALILRNPGELFRFHFCSGKERVFARIKCEERWQEYKKVFPQFPWTIERYNNNQLNSGAFMYRNESPTRVEYIDCFRRYFSNKYFQKEFDRGRFILDEEFLSFWFIMRDNAFVGSDCICTRNGPFTFRGMITPVPYIYHYAVNDSFTPDYRDFFGAALVTDSVVISGYGSKEIFDRRMPSVTPSFKYEMRKRFKNTST